MNLSSFEEYFPASSDLPYYGITPHYTKQTIQRRVLVNTRAEYINLLGKELVLLQEKLGSLLKL